MDKPTTEPVRETAAPLDFIRTIVAEDVKAGKHGGRVATRFPPEPNGYLHIGHAKSICLNFGVAAGVRRHLQPALRRHQPHEGRRRVRRLDSGRRPLARLHVARQPLYASDYFERLYEYAQHLITKGLAYVDSLTADEIRAHRGTLTEPGTAEPVSRPPDRGEPRSLCPHARRRVPRRRARAAREDRHGVAEHQPARSGALSHPARASPPHRRRVVHLPDVRLRASAVRCARAHHALALHARVRGSSAALRLADREPAGAVQAAADRVRAAEPHLHGDEQAPAAGARRGAPRLGLGRPAHADDRRDAAARLHAGGHPRVLRSHRRRQAREHGRRRAARARRARGSQPPRAARDGRARPAARRDRELSRRTRREEFEVANNPEDDAAGTRRVPFSRVLYIERDDFREEPPKKFFRLAPGAKCGCAAPTSSPALASSRIPRRARSSSCAAPTIRRRAAAMRPTDARSRRRCTGSRPRTRWASRSGSTIGSSRARTPAAIDDYRSQLNPNSLEVLTRCWIEPSVAGAPAGTRYQFERLGYFCVDADSTAGRLVFNRTVTLKDTWARIEQRG